MSTEREEAWLNAKWGEVWVLTINGVEHVQRVTQRGDFADLYRDDCGWAADASAITAGRRIWPEAAQAPTDDERQTLPVASRDVWGWDTCVVCGSEEVSDRGMVVMGVSAGNPYIARIAWCDQTQECQEDLRQTSFLLTADDVKVIDSSHRPAQGEPTAAIERLAKVHSLLSELDLDSAVTRPGTAWGSILREALALTDAVFKEGTQP